MTFNKQEQRLRAQQFAQDQLARGAEPVVLPPIQVSPKMPMGGLPATWPYQPTQVQDTKLVVPASKSVKAPKPAKKLSYLEEDFTNDIGQRIQPWNRIVAIRQGYNHSINVSEGVYLGLRRDSKGNVASVVVRASVLTFMYHVNGVRASSSTPGATFGRVPCDKILTLPRKRIYRIV